MTKKIDCVLDNLVIYVEHVHVDAFKGFHEKLGLLELQGKLSRIRFSIGQGYSDYHYRINVGEGSGAIAIGYKHNSTREREEFYRLRVEFNPAKSRAEHDAFWDLFCEVFSGNRKCVKQVDIAFDVGVNINKIFAISLTGRQRSVYKTTKYFGSRGNTGRLKIYDKKTELDEQQGVAILDEDRTRIEYTYRFEEPLSIQIFSKVHTTINSEYEIVYFDETKLTGEVKAAVLAIYHEYMEMKEFTRTMKTKIKSALDSMEKLDLDHAYQSANNKIVKTITSYLNRL